MAAPLCRALTTARAITAHRVFAFTSLRRASAVCCSRRTASLSLSFAPSAARPVRHPAVDIHGAFRVYSSDAATAKVPPGPNKIYSFDDMQNLTKASNSPVVIVDTREPSEIEDTGRIPGAINIPVKSTPDSFFVDEEEFLYRFGFARPPPDTPIVFYCKAGVRSRAAAGLAKNAGWSNVAEYPGSWLDWASNGGEVQR